MNTLCNLLDDIAAVSDIGACDGDASHLGPAGVHGHLPTPPPPSFGGAFELESVPQQGLVLVGTDDNLLLFGSESNSL